MKQAGVLGVNGAAAGAKQAIIAAAW